MGTLMTRVSFWFGVLLLTANVHAQNRPSRADLEAKAQAACGSDFSQFCPEARAPHERGRCLMQNEAKLSATCAAFVQEMKAHMPPGGPGGHHRGAPPPPPTEGSGSAQ